MNGVERIAAVRKRHIDEHEWDKDHDSQHTDESLALAACHYAIPEDYYPEILNLWPDSWDYAYNHRGETNRIRDLEKAGALIAAEIDRLLANQPLDEDAQKAGHPSA